MLMSRRWNSSRSSGVWTTTPCCSGNRSISRNIAADRPFYTVKRWRKRECDTGGNKNPNKKIYRIIHLPIVVGARVADYDWRRRSYQLIVVTKSPAVVRDQATITQTPGYAITLFLLVEGGEVREGREKGCEHENWWTYRLEPYERGARGHNIRRRSGTGIFDVRFLRVGSGASEEINKKKRETLTRVDDECVCVVGYDVCVRSRVCVCVLTCMCVRTAFDCIEWIIIYI